MIRKLTSLFLLLLIPGAMFAAEGDTAVLYGTGAVYLNGAQLATSSAVTNGDVIQTKDTGAANLNAAGSSVVIQSNTIVRFQSGGLALDRGSVTVATGRGLSVFARLQNNARIGQLDRVLHFAGERSGPDHCSQERHHGELRRKYIHHQRGTTGLA